jgi:predicted DNA-binding transcriptional regulator AlpA
MSEPPDRGRWEPPSLMEALTTQFYDWERRGRGWQILDWPVVLEPPFRPFLGHYALSPAALDDARRPSFLGRLLLEPQRGGTPAGSAPASAGAVDEAEPEPELFFSEDAVVEIETSLPPDTKVSRERAVALLSRLADTAVPASFEIVGTADAVSVQFTCAASDRQSAYGHIRAYFPDAVLRDRSGFLAGAWEDAGNAAVLVDFGLSREFMLPIRISRDFEVDPLIALVTASAGVEAHELSLFQVLFLAARQPWPESILRAVSDGEGHAFFADAPELVSLARQKVSQPLLAAVVRVATRASTPQRAWEIARNVGSALAQFSDPVGNEFIPLANDGYADEDHAADLLARMSRRTGQLLNLEELASLIHPPSASVRSEKLKRERRRSKAAPASVHGHRLVIGENAHQGATTTVSLSVEQRVRHTYVIGASGTGKSTLLLDLIMQDIGHGEGVAVLDPHGDLIDEVLRRMPDTRRDDVVLVDPADEEYAVGFNILDAHSELEKTLLSSDLVAVFRRLATSWGDQMTSVLGNAVLAFLESGRGGTLADLRRFLVDPEFRASFLPSVHDPEVVYYWRKEFPLLSGRPQAPILTRLDAFLRPRLIRDMVCQKENKLDFAAMMRGGKILLAKLAHGAIGEENAFLLGSLLVAKIHQLALARQATEEAARREFYVYIDEFQNFVTPSMASILSGARKFRIGLTLAHQELRQLVSRDPDVASAVLANAGTRICFRVGDADAKRLEDGFSAFEARDLQNLGVGEAICRVERSEWDFNLRTLTPAPPPPDAVDRHDGVVRASRERYATRRPLRGAAPQEEKGDYVQGTEPLEPPVAPSPAARKRTSRDAGEEEPEARSASVPAGGRGGTQHKYLQDLLRKWAEEHGWKVALEKPVLDGLGFVDVALERGGRSVACEIGMTTDAEHEVGNLQKCLAAGFAHVISVSADRKVQAKIRTAAGPVLTESQAKRVHFLNPEQALLFMETLGSGAPEEAASASKEILTAKEVEELLRIDVKTIYSYVQRGLMPYVRIQSNLRFMRSEILAWMAERRFRPGPHSRPK